MTLKIPKLLKTLVISVGLLAILVPAFADVNDGLVARYSLDGESIDVSGNGNHGTLNGVSFVDDRFSNPGSAGDFGGNGDYIQVSHHSSLDFGTGDFTLAVWVKVQTDLPSDTQMMVMKRNPDIPWNQYSLRYLTDGSVGIHTYAGSESKVSSSASINDGLWHHIAGVRKSSGFMEIYVDGALSNSSQQPLANVGNSSNLAIGRQGSLSIRHFNLVDADG